MAKNVLFIEGIADNQVVKMVAITPEGTSFDVGGSCNLFATLNSDGYNKVLAVFDANKSSNINLNGIDLIFNQIGEFDGFKNSLAKVDAIINQFKIPCLNKPLSIANTTRDGVYEKLQALDGLMVPKTLRLKPLSPSDIIAKIKSELKYPVIIRDVDVHGSEKTYLVKSDEEVQNLYAIALDGREYYLTQYYEYGDDDGLYRKYRLAVVDGEVFIRECIISDAWMIHAKSFDYKYEDKEKNILKRFESKIKPKIALSIKKIYEEIGLEYFGIDCHIDRDMNICIFEVNANMNMLLKRENYTDIYVDKITKSLNLMIRKR